MRHRRRGANVGRWRPPSPQPKGHGWVHIAGRIFMLLLGLVSLYLLAPKVISVLASWPQLKTLKPGWFVLRRPFEVMSYISLWAMQRVALHTTSWFSVGTTQLASGAIGSIVPGGAATAGAVAYKMLTRAGVRNADVAAGLTAATIASTAVVFAMPVLALPAIIGGVRGARTASSRPRMWAWSASSPSRSWRRRRSAGTARC